jgi:glycosyltransferase involved in cell wall biosynthesis
MTGRRLRVCIDARTTPDAGGVRQALIGLIRGLASLDDGDEEYVVIVYEDEQDWIRPYLPDDHKLIPIAQPSPSRGRRLLRKAMSGAPRRITAQAGRRWAGGVPDSGGLLERSGADVVHLAIPFGFRTELPTVYQVYDLQHLHFPEHFHPATILRREVAYRTLCEQARFVTTLTEWGKKELVATYGLQEERVATVGLGSVLDSYPAPGPTALASIRKRFSLPAEFLFFPANTWPHKNHLGLLDALALVRDRELLIPLVCSGIKTDFFPTIERRVRAIGLQDSVSFVGYVEPDELRCLFELSRAVVFPTTYEGWGMPVNEAWDARRAVACSAIPPLLEQAGGAALTFDPADPRSIADALARMWTEEHLRAELVAKGCRRADTLSWERSARIYRALYRKIGIRPLTDEDAIALAQTGSPVHPA